MGCSHFVGREAAKWASRVEQIRHPAKKESTRHVRRRFDLCVEANAAAQLDVGGQLRKEARKRTRWRQIAACRPSASCWLPAADRRPREAGRRKSERRLPDWPKLLPLRVDLFTQVGPPSRHLSSKASDRAAPAAGNLICRWKSNKAGQCGQIKSSMANPAHRSPAGSRAEPAARSLKPDARLHFDQSIARAAAFLALALALSPSRVARAHQPASQPTAFRPRVRLASGRPAAD